MQSFIENFLASKGFGFVAVAIALVAAAFLVSFMMRFSFGSRLHLPRNGRARQPRLGIVDAFNLDRQRQLVIIRRDNVEHLLMIGGPNDLVIESEIIRAESREPRTGREARFHDKEPRERERETQLELAEGLLTEAPSVNAVEREIPSPIVTKVERKDRLERPAEQSSRTSAPTAAPRAPVFPLPPRRGAAPDQRQGGQRAPLLSRLDPPPAPEGGTNSARSVRRAPAPPAFARPPLQRERPDTLVNPAQPGGSEIPPSASPSHTVADLFPAVQPLRPPASASGGEVSAPTSPASAASSGDGQPSAGVLPQIDVERLEEEMARLLGRE